MDFELIGVSSSKVFSANEDVLLLEHTYSLCNFEVKSISPISRIVLYFDTLIFGSVPQNKT